MTRGGAFCTFRAAVAALPDRRRTLPIFPRRPHAAPSCAPRDPAHHGTLGGGAAILLALPSPAWRPDLIVSVDHWTAPIESGLRPGRGNRENRLGLSRIRGNILFGFGNKLPRKIPGLTVRHFLHKKRVFFCPTERFLLGVVTGGRHENASACHHSVPRVSEIGKGRIPVSSGGNPGKVPTPQTGQKSRAQSDTRPRYSHRTRPRYGHLTTRIGRLADRRGRPQTCPCSKICLVSESVYRLGLRLVIIYPPSKTSAKAWPHTWAEGVMHLSDTVSKQIDSAR